MATAIVILHILVCILIIAVVLLQTGKGAAIGSTFGGGGLSGSIWQLRTNIPIDQGNRICLRHYLYGHLYLPDHTFEEGRHYLYYVRYPCGKHTGTRSYALQTHRVEERARGRQR